jgi:MFS family permease
VAAAASKPAGVRFHLALNALWLAVQFQDGALLAIIIPAVLLRIDPARHVWALATLTTLAAIAAAIVPPLAGAFSDRAARRGGDRRVETAIALLVDAIAIGGLVFATTTFEVGLALIAATVALTASTTIYQALLPELVPRAQWGTATGVRGALTLLGTVFGLGIAGALPATTALGITAIVLFFGALSLRLVPRRGDEKPAHAKVRDHHDLIVTLIARGFIILGMALLNTYVLYFFTDVMGVHDASLQTGLVAGSALIGAIGSSILAGVLSDRIDRRLVVAAAGVPMTLAATGFAVFPDLHYLFGYAILFGLGFGAVFSVGWALALDAIPALGDVARDLGIWATVSNLPMIVAPFIGAFLLSHAPSEKIGFRSLFACSGVCFALGSLVVLRVGARPLAPWYGPLIVLTSKVFRDPIVGRHIRIRRWGRLPFRRGATVVIANHQHEDEGEAIVQRALWDGPWLRPVFTVSSRRMYEPGFFAGRFPALAGLFWYINFGFLFRAMGMMPVENQLSSRPLRSLARALEREHGDLPLVDVLVPDALAQLPGSPTHLSDARRSRYAEAASQTIKLSYLKEPYRREMLEATRAQVDADVADIVRIVRAGSTFYINPEGTYSLDGRMHPLKGILKNVAPYATLMLVAVAYDPFQPQRLGMLYRTVAPADPADPARSLAAARPVTASALVAADLVTRTEPFTRAAAIESFSVRLRSLPSGAFVDPEVLAAPDAAAATILDELVRRSILVADGTLLRRGLPQLDARFPATVDMVTYQANFLAETIDALDTLAKGRAA